MKDQPESLSPDLKFRRTLRITQIYSHHAYTVKVRTPSPSHSLERLNFQFRWWNLYMMTHLSSTIPKEAVTVSHLHKLHSSSNNCPPHMLIILTFSSNFFLLFLVIFFDRPFQVIKFTFSSSVNLVTLTLKETTYKNLICFYVRFPACKKKNFLLFF